MYEVQIDKKEKMEITVISSNSVAIRICGGTGFKKDHGYTTLSYDGVCKLIDALSQVKSDMETHKTDYL